MAMGVSDGVELRRDRPYVKSINPSGVHESFKEGAGLAACAGRNVGDLARRSL